MESKDFTPNSELSTPRFFCWISSNRKSSVPDTHAWRVNSSFTAIVFFMSFGKKWIFSVDTYDSRILIFDVTAGISNGMTATYILGQGTPTDYLPVYGGLSYPVGAVYDATRQWLFVSDTGGNQIAIPRHSHDVCVAI